MNQNSIITILLITYLISWLNNVIVINDQLVQFTSVVEQARTYITGKESMSDGEHDRISSWLSNMKSTIQQLKYSEFVSPIEKTIEDVLVRMVSK